MKFKGVNLIVVTSKTCSPCKTLKTRLNLENISFIELNVIEIDGKFNVMSVPTTFLMEDEEILERMDGFNVPDYKNIIKKYKEMI